MSVEYLVPSQSISRELVVKKSRFIAYGFYANSREKALECIEVCRNKYPDARHHCWAYLVGPPQSPITLAMSDDGEPSGTAGKPILNVLQHKTIGDVMVVVVRYFGGIKLGAGGLVRAYSGATESLMSQIPCRTCTPMTTLQIKTDFSNEQNVRHWVDVYEGKIISVEYSEMVFIVLELPLSFEAAFKEIIVANQITLIDHE